MSEVSSVESGDDRADAARLPDRAGHRTRSAGSLAGRAGRLVGRVAVVAGFAGLAWLTAAATGGNTADAQPIAPQDVTQEPLRPPGPQASIDLLLATATNAATGSTLPVDDVPPPALPSFGDVLISVTAGGTPAWTVTAPPDPAPAAAGAETGAWSATGAWTLAAGAGETEPAPTTSAGATETAVASETGPAPTTGAGATGTGVAGEAGTAAGPAVPLGDATRRTAARRVATPPPIPIPHPIVQPAPVISAPVADHGGDPPATVTGWPSGAAATCGGGTASSSSGGGSAGGSTAFGTVWAGGHATAVAAPRAGWTPANEHAVPIWRSHKASTSPD